MLRPIFYINLIIAVNMKKNLYFFISSIFVIFAAAFTLKKGPKQKIIQGDTFLAPDDYQMALPLYLEAYK